ncbi:lipocalin-1-like [Cervus elaphus]|uniref:lipocalin-1-like n=1 Tax=Cervus elaphus TaxID=9860 RepID=UPI001CC31D90|nr:lipocalin-1-like [Cervus elaphus]
MASADSEPGWGEEGPRGSTAGLRQCRHVERRHPAALGEDLGIRPGSPCGPGETPEPPLVCGALCGLWLDALRRQEMRALLLTLGLVASLQAQVAPVLDSSTEDVSGKWYLKAVTTDQDVLGKDQESVLAMTFSVLERGDLEAKVTSQADGRCQEASLLLEKTDDPGRYTAYGGRREVFILPLRARDHFILYCEGELAGRQVRMARLLGRNLENSPEALVEFTEFAEAQSLNLEIFRPLQSETCSPGGN